MGLYQSKLKDRHIRRLYFLAKKQKKPMTAVLNEIVEEALIGEPEPPPYEVTAREWPTPETYKRKERAVQK